MEINNENILCPYCGSICGDYESFSGDMNDDIVDFKCEECNKKFQGERVVTVDYRSEKDCSLNSEKHMKGDYHCKKCDIYNSCMKDGEFKE